VGLFDKPFFSINHALMLASSKRFLE
jgi:hypothetical protein